MPLFQVQRSLFGAESFQHIFQTRAPREVSHKSHPITDMDVMVEADWSEILSMAHKPDTVYELFGRISLLLKWNAVFGIFCFAFVIVVKIFNMFLH